MPSASERPAANEQQLLHDLHREVEDQHAHAVVHGDPGRRPNGLAASNYDPSDPAVVAGAIEAGERMDDEIAAKRQEWAIYLGDKIVTVYEDEDTAADSLVWYIETYGSARLTDVLTIGPVRDA